VTAKRSAATAVTAAICQLAQQYLDVVAESSLQDLLVGKVTIGQTIQKNAART
jgi:hypothetical protein